MDRAKICRDSSAPGGKRSGGRGDNKENVVSDDVRKYDRAVDAILPAAAVRSLLGKKCRNSPRETVSGH